MMQALLIANEGLGGHGEAHQDKLWWFAIVLFVGIVLALWRFNHHQRERAEREAADEILERELADDARRGTR